MCLEQDAVCAPKMLSFCLARGGHFFFTFLGFGLWSRFVFPHSSSYLLSVIIASERNSSDIFNILVVLYSYRLIFPPEGKSFSFLQKYTKL